MITLAHAYGIMRVGIITDEMHPYIQFSSSRVSMKNVQLVVKKKEMIYV